MKSGAHPNHTIGHGITNRAELGRAFVSSSSNINLWTSLDTVGSWNPRRSGKREAPRRYSSVALATALMPRLVRGLPLRHADGFLQARIRSCNLIWIFPTTLCASWASYWPQGGRDLRPLEIRTRRDSGNHGGTNSSSLPLVDPAIPPNRPPHRKLEWSGQRDSNPRHSAWEADALPTELWPPMRGF